MVPTLEELTVSRQELATLLGLSSARVGQMVGAGTIPAPIEHGRYRLAECVRKYCEYTRSDSRSKGSKKFTDARAEWMASKARKAALEEQAASDEFIPVAAMNEAWCAIGTVLRQRYLSVPNRLASRFAEFKTAQGLFDACMSEINDVLTELNRMDGHELDHLCDGQQSPKLWKGLEQWQCPISALCSPPGAITKIHK
jgi:phage terminase Nu1 subunit (DNA packaging protein)